MGKIVRQGVEYGGSSNSADCIKYNETKSVKEAIDEIKASSSSNPTAASVTFDNTDTGLNATNVQDAVTEVNGKYETLDKYIGLYIVDTGTFRVALKANSSSEITTSNIINGKLPTTTMTTLTIVGNSAARNRTAEFFFDNDKVYGYSSVAQTYTVRWFSFARR